MSWIQTHTGRRVDVFEPRIEDIVIEDIAHALSHMCRYAGHCSQFYSVGQHSLYVAEALKMGGYSPLARLVGLLHDASEAYLVDIPRPIKHHEKFAFYREVEDNLMFEIHEALGVPPQAAGDYAVAVSGADNAVLAKEAQLLMLDTKDWFLPEAPWIGAIVPSRDFNDVKTEFINQYFYLKQRVAEEVA